MGVYIGITLSVHLLFCLRVRLCPLSISLPAQPFFTKLGMVMYCHELMCHVEKVVHYLQGQGNSKSLCNQSMTIFTISSKLLVCLEPNLVS